MNNVIEIKDFKIANHLPLVLIAGPCQMESREHALMMVEKLCNICKDLNINFIYKTSFDKANRSSIKGARGIGISGALPIFAEIKEKFNCPILTDVHDQEQCGIISKFVDILQIPAFLCRQTDLIAAAAATNKIVNVKKGQFLAPWDMKNIVDKLKYFGNEKVILTDRGASFGYNNLVSDMRSLSIMAETGAPVVFDATHSVQKPGYMGFESGGERRFVPVLSRAATAVGIAAIFIETHQDPDNAPSDGACMINIKDLPGLLKTIKKIDNFIKE